MKLVDRECKPSQTLCWHATELMFINRQQKVSQVFASLPSLTSLKAFEAAARLGSFKQAADELGVTPAAIGSRIQALEDRLDVVLFRRSHRKVEPTDAAMELQRSCNVALSMLMEAVDAVAPAKGRNILTVGVGTLFAARWLSPRLNQFWLAHPEVALRLVHAPDLTKPLTSELDAVIAWGEGKWPEVKSELLLRPQLVPVASADYIVRYGRPERPHDLRRHTLVHERGQRAWCDWFASHGLDYKVSEASTTVRDGVLALQLAIDGQAIALGVEEFLRSELSSGVLERIFENPVQSKEAYFLAISEGRQNTKQLDHFMQWIISESETSVTFPRKRE